LKEKIMQLKLSSFFAITVAALIMASPLFFANGQSIDVDLPGSSASDAFTVKDKAGSTLFKIFGDNKLSIGTATHTANHINIVSPVGMQSINLSGSHDAKALVNIINKSTSTSGGTTAIRGTSLSPDGKAISAINSATTGTGDAIYGAVYSPDAFAIRGNNTVTHTYGLLGTPGTGVYGSVSNGAHVGLYGINTAATGDGYGVYGETRSSSGVGIYAKATQPGAWAGYFSGNINVTGGIDLDATLMANGYVYCKDKLGIQKPTNIIQMSALAVWGDAAKTGGGSWTSISDIRLKDVRGVYTKGLKDIIQLEPIRFNYKKDNPRGYPSDAEEYGYSAQAVQKVFPEAVTEQKDGYLDMNLHTIHIATVSAVKELHELILKQNERIKKLERELAQYRSTPEDSKFSHSTMSK
jgi:Chaperone of endosialidase